jgi:2'-5' RNA ligase
MAALMFQVPEETARVLREVPVPGDPEKNDPHITVLFLGKDVPIDKISSMIPAIYEVTSQTLPFTVATSHISNFPGGKDGVPIIAKINSPALHRFQEELRKAFEEADIAYDNKWPEYKPHTTLAYDTDPKTTIDLDIPEVSWGAHELVLWGSNNGTGRIVVKFPLSLPQGKVAAEPDETEFYRIAVKLAAWRQQSQTV